jgi:quercetin dioxygenase-like cupin family protein
MATQKYNETPAEQIAEGVERRIGYLNNLMIVTIDFTDGPTSEPDPPHSHPHEQISYVAEGEILFILDGEETRLGPGDVFLVPSSKLHTIQRLTEHVRLVDCFTPLREDFL